MNIFALHIEPKVAAEYHCDSHVVKMIVESCQMLSTAHRVCGSDKAQLSEIGAMKAFNENHPCNRWVIASASNYEWLSRLAFWLCEEYTYRYGKRHANQSTIEYLMAFKPNIEDFGLQPFALAMPDEIKKYAQNEFKLHTNLGQTIMCYRVYYAYGKSKILKYTKRQQPSWIEEIKNLNLL